MTSTTIHQTLGNGAAYWQEDTPLKWTMQQPARADDLPPDTIKCDLSTLAFGYEENFLLALKDVLLLSKHRKRLVSIQNEYDMLRQVLGRVAGKESDRTARMRQIDSGFLVALEVIAHEVPSSYLKSLKAFHRRHRADTRLFSMELQPGDFPKGQSKRSAYGDRIHSILAKALRRSTLVYVLNIVEAAFEENRLDLGRYAFIRLALNIFCRPDSYRRLTLSDLKLDKNEETGAINYFLDVPPAKSGVHKPQKISYRLHPEVGKLLALQRQAVVEKFGHLAPVGKDGPAHGRLALFPAISLNSDGGWLSAHAHERLGILPRGSFNVTYLKPIKDLASTPLSFNGFRHTIGTQLAQMGCSSHTIQAVLKHADESSARTYVDIVFEGLIDELSDSLQPAFEAHFPVIQDFVSSTFAMPAERRIESTDLETSRTETTGMCGRRVACAYAPLSCYDCPRFIPCYDVDHTINLDIVSREIEASEGRGKAMLHDVKKWKTIRNRIRITIVACELKLRSLETAAETKL